MKTVRGSLLAATFVLTTFWLPGCNNAADDTAMDEEAAGEIAPAIPTDDATPTPNPSATTSILRTDIEQPLIDDEPLVVLEPLRVTVGFPEGGSQLDEAAIEQLEEVLASEHVANGGAIVLRGHSDAGGSGEANIRASRARADQVRAWLEDEGIASDRITVIVFGEQNPIAPNALPDGSPNAKGRERNRRVEITVAPDEDDDIGQNARQTDGGEAARDGAARSSQGGDR